MSLLTILVASILVLSLFTVGLGILYILFQTFKKRGAGAIKTITVVTGILSSVGALWLKMAGAQVTPADEGRETIASFYNHLEAKDFSQAYDLIHPARRQETKSQGRDYEDFKTSYSSTRDFRNFQISADKIESIGIRTYLVSYDVKDSSPVSTLREESWLDSRVLMDTGVFNEEKVMGIILDDLRRGYDFPETLSPKVREYVRRTSPHYLLQPSLVEDIGDWLHLKKRAISTKDSWSHHVEYLTLERENGWKIRNGLFPPLFDGQYPPGVEPIVASQSVKAAGR